MGWGWDGWGVSFGCWRGGSGGVALLMVSGLRGVD